MKAPDPIQKLTSGGKFSFRRLEIAGIDNEPVFRVNEDAPPATDANGAPLDLGTGIRLVPLIPVATRTDFRAGPLQPTGNALGN